MIRSFTRHSVKKNRQEPSLVPSQLEGSSVIAAGVVVVPTGCRFHLLTVPCICTGGGGSPAGSEGRGLVELLARLEGRDAPFGGRSDKKQPTCISGGGNTISGVCTHSSYVARPHIAEDELYTIYYWLQVLLQQVLV